MKPRGLALALLLGSMIVAPRDAAADIAGPRSACESSQCHPCWRTYDGKNGDPLSEDDSDGFEKCAAPLREKGWDTSCSDKKERGEDVWFCPSDATQPGRRGGCAGCAVSTEGSVALVGVGAALAVAFAFRLRRRGRRARDAWRSLSP